MVGGRIRALIRVAGGWMESTRRHRRRLGEPRGSPRAAGAAAAEPVPDPAKGARASVPGRSGGPHGGDRLRLVPPGPARAEPRQRHPVLISEARERGTPEPAGPLSQHQRGREVDDVGRSARVHEDVAVVQVAERDPSPVQILENGCHPVEEEVVERLSPQVGQGPPLDPAKRERERADPAIALRNSGHAFRGTVSGRLAPRHQTPYRVADDEGARSIILDRDVRAVEPVEQHVGLCPIASREAPERGGRREAARVHGGTRGCARLWHGVEHGKPLKALGFLLLELPDTPNIPSSAGAHNRPAIPSRAPRREEIAAATVGLIQRGGDDKADLLLVDLGEGRMVVKDFAAKSGWTRFLGRIQIHRELRAYRCLGRIRGIPALIGPVDSLAFAVERVEGERLHGSPDPRSKGAEHLRNLRVLIDRIHAAGVVHNDLRGRENLMLTPDGDLVILDLAGAFCFRPGSLALRLFFRSFAVTDEAAYLKWKEFLVPGRFTPEEEAFLRRFRVLRRLWPFNRKRRRSTEARP